MTPPTPPADGADDSPPAPDDAFAALSDPVRVETLRVLAEQHRDTPDDPGLAFSTLRRRVGVDDSGRFLYHLKQLLGTFVAKTDDGYRLTEAGHAVTAAIAAGTYTRHETLAPTDLDSVCPLCGEQVVGRYTDGSLRVTCRAEHPLFVWSLPPNAAAGSTVADLVDLARLDLSHTVEWMLAGSCPVCWSPTTTRLDGLDDATESDDFDEPEDSDDSGDSDTANTDASLGFTATCDVCGVRVVGPAGFALLGQPAVDAFYHRHGSSPREQYLWELPFVQRDAAVELSARRGEDEKRDGAARVRFSLELGDETLTVFLDECAQVTSTAVRPKPTDGAEES